jgi:hypothetical protein
MTARIQLSSLRERIAQVSPWGFPMEVSYEFEEGEPPILSASGNFDHPGYPANVAMLSCRVGGVDITEMVRNEQQERIEEAVLRLIEG